MVDDAQLDALEQKLTHVIWQLKLRALMVMLLNSLLLAVGLSLPVYFFVKDLPLSLLVALIALVVGAWWQWRDGNYQRITLTNLLEHFNRNANRYQESAQLYLADENTLTLVAKLQRSKVIQLLSNDAANDMLKKLQPKLDLTLTGWLVGLAIVTLLLSLLVAPLLELKNTTQADSPISAQADSDVQAVTLVGQRIKIIPPVYTGIPVSESRTLDLKIPQGSSVEWELEFSDPALNYFLQMGDDPAIALSAIRTSGAQTIFQVSRPLENTQLYRLLYEKNMQRSSLPGVYTIAVTKDQPPKIQLVKPQTSLLEIHSADAAEVAIEAIIKDDYGVGDVNILASVAKGSGEAVKFRDETFTFEIVTSSKEGKVYQKQWHLKDLGMEPGDEVYFSVLASDNKSPEPQQSKSSSVIVRWLDDKETELAAEGMQIRFKPEYFRSQRQIIIETEQLIADQSDLERQAFEEKSTDLGHSQRDLKEKYGQYLGDEFGEGSGDQLDESDHADEKPASGSQDGTTNSAQTSASHQEAPPEVGHMHQEMVNSLDHSGASELIAQFAHNHGGAEVGPMSSRDPKSWMKQAVSIMWQAELHLMLSEPEKALPFEYEAYRFLKLARQAERIYVKRLGFEPPPVSESNRLQGDLKDIENRHWIIEDLPLTDSDQMLFRQVYAGLSQWRSDALLSMQQQTLLQQLRSRLLILAEARPVLIGYAATLQRILNQRSLNIGQCEGCIQQLRQKIWQLLDPVESSPSVAVRAKIKNTAALQQYLIEVTKLAEKENKEAMLQDAIAEDNATVKREYQP